MQIISTACALCLAGRYQLQRLLQGGVGIPLPGMDAGSNVPSIDAEHLHLLSDVMDGEKHIYKHAGSEKHLRHECKDQGHPRASHGSWLRGTTHNRAR